MANSRHPRRNDPRAVPSALIAAGGPARPATGPHVFSNSSANSLRPNRLRACVMALEVGTLHPAFQHPNRSNEPVTLAATSVESSSGNNTSPNVRYAVTCAGSLPSERCSRTPHTATASSTASRGTSLTNTPSVTRPARTTGRPATSAVMAGDQTSPTDRGHLATPYHSTPNPTT